MKLKSHLGWGHPSRFARGDCCSQFGTGPFRSVSMAYVCAHSGNTHLLVHAAGVPLGWCVSFLRLLYQVTAHLAA